MTDNIPLYNSIIIKTYVDFLEDCYPDVNIKELLEYSNITNYELEDRGHWLTQEQVNRFQEHIERVTTNPNIAKEAGRNIASPKSSSLIRHSLAGLLSPTIAYWAAEKLGATISRHQTMKVNKLNDNKIEIIAKPHNNVKEELYQCMNRIGMFEAVAEVFTHKYANIEHPECIHLGGNCCQYIISWELPPSFIWKKVGSYLFALSILAAFPLFFFLSVTHWLIFFLLSLLASACTLLWSNFIDSKEMTQISVDQGKASDQLFQQIEFRYNEALLIKEIGEAASSILEPQKLLNFITDALQKRLQFSRGMIMLTNPEKTKLVYTTGYGYIPEEETLLKNIDFNLTNPESKGVFYLAYNEQKPFLISDINEIKDDLSEKTTKFIKELGVEAFICVPITYEGKSEGILAVDNTRSKNKPTQSDLSLLMGIAPQIGISLNNALAHKKIKESNERFRNLSDNSPDIIYQLDVNGMVKYINPAWKDVLGHNIDDLLCKNITDFIREEERTAFDEIFQTIINNKLTIRDKNFIMLNNKGLPRYMTFTGAPDLDAEGKVIGAVGTLKDISRLRSMEAQLLQASKMEAIGTLTGGIAHDFNNIIQAIMGYNQLMISGRNGNASDMLYLNSVEELIQRSRELVKQLMLFSKKAEPLSAVININDEIKSMQNLMFKSIPKMIEIKTSLDENIFPMKADSTQIGQIIMNLVINARDAMGDNGTINISTKNLSLQENTSIAGFNIPAGKYIELSVADTGCGMEINESLNHFLRPKRLEKEPAWDWP